MEQSPSWEANWFSASQEILRILWNSKVHYCIHKCFLQMIRNRIRFSGEKFLAPCPTPKLEDHLLSAVRDCVLNILAATLHTGGRTSIRNLRTCHAVVTGTHLHIYIYIYIYTVYTERSNSYFVENSLFPLERPVSECCIRSSRCCRNHTEHTNY